MQNLSDRADLDTVVPPCAATADNAMCVEAEKTRILYAQSPTGLIVVMGLMLVIAWLLRAAVSSAPLLAWCAAVTAISAARAWLVYRFTQRPTTASDSGRWRHRFVAGALASALAWGAVGVVFAPQVGLEEQLVLTFVLGGLAAGAVPALAPVFTVYALFAITSLLPMTLFFLYQWTEAYIAMGIMALIYLGAMLSLGRSYAASVTRTLRLAHHNDRLIDDLRSAKETAEASARRLESEVAERRSAEAALRESETEFKDFASLGADILFETDAEIRYTRVQGDYENIFGKSASHLLGHTREEALAECIVDPLELEEHRKRLAARQPFSDFRFTCTDARGNHVVLLSSARPIFDAEDAFRGYRGVARNVTEAHLLSQQLRYQATHDPLTNLSNRRELERRLERLVEHARAEDSQHALCYLDLDQFKVVNDTCGHPAGDELLRQLSERLRQHVRSRDTLARLGGDEFALLLEHCTIAQARRVVGALRDTIGDFRFEWEGQFFPVGASIGLVPVTRDSGDISEVLSAADSACYAAKEQGRNRVHVYSADDVTLAKRSGEMRWVSRINKALEEDRFELYAQPIFALEARAPARASVQILSLDDADVDETREPPDATHFELLVRMLDEDGSSIPPGAFLPAAERYNLSPRIDRWVIDHAFEWLTRDAGRLRSTHICAINLSGNSLGDEEFAEFVTRSLSRFDVPAGKILFEVTETAAISRLGAAKELIASLSALGCRFALDDFGSGLSSFGYLKTLPVEFLKIDGLFVKDMVDDPMDFAMVKSINEMGKVMQKQTIAEFVESREILDKLREIGVDYAQGYYLGKPTPIQPLAAPRSRAASGDPVKPIRAV